MTMIDHTLKTPAPYDVAPLGYMKPQKAIVSRQHGVGILHFNLDDPGHGFNSWPTPGFSFWLPNFNE